MEKFEKTRWGLYVIIDPNQLAKDLYLFEVAKAALVGGAGVLQLRDKNSDARSMVKTARRLKMMCDEHDALFVVNDRLDVALAANADGVHLGPNDISVSDARQIAPWLVIGASTGSPDKAIELVSSGANYLGVGAIYDARESKSDASLPRGPEAITAIKRVVDVPVVGIGGINRSNAAEVIEAGADGIAVIRAVIGSHSPRKSAKALAKIVKKAAEVGEE